MFFDFNVYVACSLTNAPEEFRQMVYSFQDDLAKVCRVLRFLGLTNHSGRETYNYDIKTCVDMADLLVGIADFPSTGFGWELCHQCEVKGGPAIVLAYNQANVTKFILDPDVPDYRLVRYGNLRKEGVEIVANKLRKMNEARCRQLSLFADPPLRLVG